MAEPPVVPPDGIAVPPTTRAHELRLHLRDPLYRNAYMLIAGTGLTALLGFVFWAIAAHSYSPEDVGRNAATISAMMLVSGICSLGLDAILVRYLPTAGQWTRMLILRSYAVTAALSLAGGALAAATSNLWSPRLGFLADDAGWLVGFTLATAAWTLFTLQDNVMTGLRAAHWVPLENAVYSVAKLALLAAVAGALPFAGPFLAWNAPVAAAVLVITILIFKRLVPRHLEAHAESSINRQQLIRVAWGNYGGTLFGLARTLMMPVLVANITSSVATAYFYVPWTIALSVLLVGLNMTISLTVEAAIDGPQLRRLARRTLAQTMRLLLPLVGITILAAPLILALFGGSYSEEGSTLLRLLVAGAIPNAFIVLGIAVARVQHKGGSVLLIQAAQCLLLLGPSALLLDSTGIDGVGIAWLGSQVVVAAALVAGLLRPLLFPVTAAADE